LGKVKDAAKSNDDEIVVEILRLRLVAAEDAEDEVWAIVN
jgi:hypothetical protein